jgi:F-type H+-transporting ATPase subunit c
MKSLKIVAVMLSILFVAQAPVMAQTSVADQARIASAGTVKGFSDVRPLGVGLVILGAGIGIGWITRSAVESIARQPEMANSIQTAMIIGAALIEGAAFFALIILGFLMSPY